MSHSGDSAILGFSELTAKKQLHSVGGSYCHPWGVGHNSFHSVGAALCAAVGWHAPRCCVTSEVKKELLETRKDELRE